MWSSAPDRVSGSDQWCEATSSRSLLVSGSTSRMDISCTAILAAVAYPKRYTGRTSRRRTWLHHRDCIRCRPSAPRCDHRVAIAPTHQTSCCAAATIAPQPRVIACTQSTRGQNHPSLSATAPGPERRLAACNDTSAVQGEGDITWKSLTPRD